MTHVAKEAGRTVSGWDELLQMRAVAYSAKRERDSNTLVSSALGIAPVRRVTNRSAREKKRSRTSTRLHHPSAMQ
jgi:hypothetical protein